MKQFGYSLLFLLMISASVAWSVDISVSQSLDKSEVSYDGSAQLQITLTWNGSQFSYLFDKPLNPVTDRLKIREFSSSLSTSGSGSEEVTTKVFRYTLIPTSSGIGKIQPITISYLKWPDSIPGVLTTEELSIGIGERRVETKGDSVSKTVIIFSILGFLAMVTGGYIVFKQRTARNAAPQISPTQIFLDRLGQLKSDVGGDFGRFQSGLYHLLGEFIRVRYTVQPDGLSEDDLSGALNSAGMAYSSAQKISKWYVAAREDRFRPVKPEPGALVRLESDIRSTIETL